jgi:hypothetical protein
MSDTPETDAAVLASDWGWSLALKETCRRLERERNSLRDQRDFCMGEIERLKVGGWIAAMMKEGT